MIVQIAPKIYFIFSNPKMKFCLVAFVVFIVFSSTADGKKLPSFIQKCKRTDPQLNDCMKETMLKFRPHLKDGVKALKISSFNPYIVPESSASTGWMNLTFINTKLFGIPNFEIDSLKVNLDGNPVIAMTFSIPNLELSAHYRLDGKIIQYQVHAEGEYESKFNKSRFSVLIDGDKIQKDGAEYMHLHKIDFNILELPFQFLYLHNLFEGNQELTDRLNAILLEDNDIFYKDLKPLLEEIVSAFVLSIFKGPFDTFSLDELFD